MRALLTRLKRLETMHAIERRPPVELQIGYLKKLPAVWDSPSPKFIMGGSDETKFDHPTQKPVELMRRPILNHTKRGELVYDPFLGSGTTLAAAELTERVCCGMELDPKYCDVIVQRWQDLSGKKATLEDDGRTFEEIAHERRGNNEGRH